MTQLGLGIYECPGPLPLKFLFISRLPKLLCLSDAHLREHSVTPSPIGQKPARSHHTHIGICVDVHIARRQLGRWAGVKDAPPPNACVLRRSRRTIPTPLGYMCLKDTCLLLLHVLYIIKAVALPVLTLGAHPGSHWSATRSQAPPSGPAADE